MTATSSPGFSLMQEAISFSIMTETPLVIVDVQRPGPGQGYINTSQEDVMQAFLHVAVYAGVPRANHAIRLAKDTFAEMERDGA